MEKIYKKFEEDYIMNKRMYIRVQTQFDAIHCYPNAPKKVKHLQNKHRHTFIITAQIEVEHNNRELEFYLVKDYLDNIIKKKDLNNLSCEMINDIFYKKLVKKYGQRSVIMETSEDGMRSAVTYYNFKEL